MNKTGYVNFAKLCESLVLEASSSIDLFKGFPGGDAVIRKLHSDYKLSHNQEYMPIDKISWSILKDMSRGGWVLVKGQNGTGAIIQKNGSYTAVTSNGNDPEVYTNDRGGNILDFFKTNIGKIVRIYQGREEGGVKNKQEKRAALKKNPAKQMNSEVLMNKFKPLWIKAINSAIADIKGHITTQIKNDAFEKAKKKLNQVEKLQNMIDTLETGGNMDRITGPLSNAVHVAVLMAASHYYPDQTGSITKSYSDNYVAQNQEGTQLLLKAVSDGDTLKLGTILGFFKRSLISG